MTTIKQVCVDERDVAAFTRDEAAQHVFDVFRHEHKYLQPIRIVSVRPDQNRYQTHVVSIECFLRPRKFSKSIRISARMKQLVESSR